MNWRHCDEAKERLSVYQPKHGEASTFFKDLANNVLNVRVSSDPWSEQFIMQQLGVGPTINPAVNCCLHFMGTVSFSNKLNEH